MRTTRRTSFLAGVAALALVLAGAAFPARATRPGLSPDWQPNVEPSHDGCTSILVGKAASADGSVMTTHTCDCGVCDWTWRHVPAADHKPGTMKKIVHVSQFQTWKPAEGLKWDIVAKMAPVLQIPEAPHTYAYHHAMFGYMNEHQLAIGESTIGNQRKMENPTPTPAFDITSLTLIAMERAKTAREAIKLMGSLAETYGYGMVDDGEMLAVADPNEVWMFEIMPVGPLWTPKSGKPGAVWAAQRVPDDEVSVCPNESRIGELDLANADFFMASPNAVSLAVEMGFYDPKSGKPFSWKRAYSPVEGSAASTDGRIQRLWRFYDLVAPSKKYRTDLPNMDFPFSVKPDRKVTLEDVFAMTRDRSAGTPFDPVQGIRGGPFKNPHYHRQTRLIDDGRAEYTTVTQSRAGLPGPVGGITWISFGSQETAAYMPLYAGATDVPATFKVGDHWTFTRDSARWASDYVDYHTQPVWNEALKDVEAARAKWETEVVRRIPETDAKALELYKRKPAEAARFLTGFCLTNAKTVVDAWWKLGDDLLVKYNRLYLYSPEKRNYERGKPGTPDWWKRAAKALDALMEPDSAKK